MKKVILLASALFSLNVFAQFNVTQENAGLGANQSVSLEKSTKFNLIGSAIKVGDYIPSLQLTTSGLGSFDTSSKSGKARIYSILASVDTPVCVQQSIDLAKYVKDNANELNDIEFYAISADTPFAQQRFIKEHSLNSEITFLSDSANHEFGLKTGTQIKELGLLTRSIIVVDKNNKVIHIQRVPELTTLPDLENSVNVAKRS